VASSTQIASTPFESVGRLVDDLLSPSQDRADDAVQEEVPRRTAAPEVDIHSKARAHSPALHGRVSQPRPRLRQDRRVLLPHSPVVGAGEPPRVYRRIRGLPLHRFVGKPPGHRPTNLSWALQTLRTGPSNPIGMQHSTIVLIAAESWRAAHNSKASTPGNVIQSESANVVSGTPMHLGTRV